LPPRAGFISDRRGFSTFHVRTQTAWLFKGAPLGGLSAFCRARLTCSIGAITPMSQCRPMASLIGAEPFRSARRVVSSGCAVLDQASHHALHPQVWHCGGKRGATPLGEPVGGLKAVSSPRSALRSISVAALFFPFSPLDVRCFRFLGCWLLVLASHLRSLISEILHLLTRSGRRL